MPRRVQILSAPPRQPCPVLVHEYGHLAGYRDPLNPSDPFHSHDPDNIMYAFPHPDARCSDHGTPAEIRARNDEGRPSGRPSVQLKP